MKSTWVRSLCGVAGGRLLRIVAPNRELVAQRDGASRQMVQQGAFALLRRRRGRRRLRHDRLQRRQTGGRRHRRAGRLCLLRLGQREDDAAIARGGRRASRRHRDDGPSRRGRDPAAGDAGGQGRHQDDVSERAGAGRGRQGRRRLCRRAAGAAGPRARRRNRAPVRPRRAATWRSCLAASTMSIRDAREEGTAKALEEGGVKVVRLDSPPEWATDPNLAIPVDHRGLAGQSDRQGDRLSRRPGARQRRHLYEGRGQEAGRNHQCRLRHQPADRAALSTAAGCS